MPNPKGNAAWNSNVTEHLCRSLLFYCLPDWSCEMDRKLADWIESLWPAFQVCHRAIKLWSIQFTAEKQSTKWTGNHANCMLNWSCSGTFGINDSKNLVRMQMANSIPVCLAKFEWVIAFFASSIQVSRLRVLCSDFALEPQRPFCDGASVVRLPVGEAFEVIDRLIDSN